MSDIYSMTGFARKQCQDNWGNAICEIRSINHRYLELSTYLPETLRNLDGEIREQIRKYIKRGKVECFVKLQSASNNQQEETINVELVNYLINANEKITKKIHNPAPINTLEILKWPGVLQVSELDFEAIKKSMMALVKETVLELLTVRAREGQELKNTFTQRITQMDAEVSKVMERMPLIIKAQREKLMNFFKETKLELDENRLEQEMVIFAHKADVTEEMDRLAAHLLEVRRTLDQGGAVGRRLDFLMQELNREANTLGSKSVDIGSSRASIELKVLIEQMREQVQNIE